MSRGGPRSGVNGKTYQNRTDLNPTAMPITAVPGQGYGVAGAQKAAQSVAPMASGPIASSNPQANTPPPLTGKPPGATAGIFGPTQRPNEHFMTGVDAGPGQGSEALAPMPGTNNVADTILAQLATIPNASSAVNFTKNFLAAQQQNQMPH